MTNTQEKIRALFLSALMVFSVFAGTVAFSGAAAAAANDGGTPEDLVTSADSIDQQITGLTFDASGEDAEVEIESLNDTGADLTDASVLTGSLANVSSSGPVTIEIDSGTTDPTTVSSITINDINTSGASATDGLTYTAVRGALAMRVTPST